MLNEHYEAVGFALFALAFMAPALPACYFLGKLSRLNQTPEQLSGARKRFFATAALGLALYTAIFTWGGLVEPRWPQLSRETVTGPFDPPLRLLHLTDLHLEKDFPTREQWMLRQVETLKPDLIVITGDIHQMGNEDTKSLSRVLSQINAPLGVYGCVGFDNTRVLHDAAPQLRLLENETATLHHGGRTIALAGLSWSGRHTKVYDAMAGADYRIVLHHTPDLAEEAAAHGANLYLCGHTHGGQVRLPLWGAVITLAETGKRFESGRYQVGNTTVYTCRGLGLEPKPAPQVRFLCRPEICLFTIGSK